jgi:hypothetical protein
MTSIMRFACKLLKLTILYKAKKNEKLYEFNQSLQLTILIHLNNAQLNSQQKRQKAVELICNQYNEVCHKAMNLYF